MGGLLIIIGVVVVMIVLLYFGSKSDVPDEISTQELANQESKPDQNNRSAEIEWLYDEAEMLFEDNGWDEWDKSVHHASGQRSRIERALKYSEGLSVVQYNPVSEYAKIRSKHNYYLVSKHGCSCPDFRERALPCKHMYFLANDLISNDKTRYDEHDNLPSFCEDAILYGLRFMIMGRGQEEVKKYINSHFGSFAASSSFQGVTAIVVADGKETARVAEAKSKNVMTFSFEEFKKLFTEEAE